MSDPHAFAEFTNCLTDGLVVLPPDIGAQRIAVVGVSGSGKTYGSGKLVEVAVAHGHQVVILDVVGNWRGLRLAADGVSPGIAMPVLGGPAGDAPLAPGSGERVARLVATRATSLIVDLSDFVLEEQAEFVRAFASTLLLLKTRHPSPVLVVWEECHETIPQVPEGKLQARAVGAAARLIKRGRNYGVGTVLISQRPAAVHKEALSQCDTLVAFALTESNDRATIKRQATSIRGRDKTPAMADLGRLPELDTGTAILWSPRWLHEFREVRILPKWTFDFSRTPDAIATARGQLAQVDLDGLRAALAEAGAGDDEDDVEALRAEVKRLRDQVRGSPSDGATDAMIEEIAALRAEVADLRGWAQVAWHLHARRSQLIAAAFESMREDGDLVGPPVPRTPTPARHIGPVKSVRVHVVASPPRHGKREAIERSGARADGDRDAKPDKMARAMLTTLAQHPAGLTKRQMRVQTGYSASGAVSACFAEMGRAGWVEPRGSGLAVTKAGLKALGQYTPLPTGDALRASLLAEGSRLDRMERAMLEVIATCYPAAVAKETVRSRTGYSASGAVSAAFAHLIALDYVVQPGKNMVRAADELFDHAARRAS